MLIKEVINNTIGKSNPDLFRDKQKVKHNNVDYTWDNDNQVFVTKVNGVDVEIEQGSRQEYEIIRSAGFIKQGGELHPTLKTRFKGMLNKGPLAKSKAPGFLGKIGQDVGSQTGFGKKVGAGIGSLIGQGLDKIIGGPNEIFPVNLQMHFMSKKGEPINVLLQQEFQSKDLKSMVDNGQLVKVKTKKDNRTFGISPNKLVTGFAK